MIVSNIYYSETQFINWFDYLNQFDRNKTKGAVRGAALIIVSQECKAVKINTINYHKEVLHHQKEIMSLHNPYDKCKTMFEIDDRRGKRFNKINLMSNCPKHLNCDLCNLVIFNTNFASTVAKDCVERSGCSNQDSREIAVRYQGLLITCREEKVDSNDYLLTVLTREYDNFKPKTGVKRAIRKLNKQGARLLTPKTYNILQQKQRDFCKPYGLQHNESCDVYVSLLRIYQKEKLNS